MNANDDAIKNSLFTFITTKNINTQKILQASWISTPLGPMITIADNNFLYFLEFINSHKLRFKIEKFISKINTKIIFNDSTLINLIKTEIDLYFDRKLKQFSTPIFFYGSAFQQRVWTALSTIPYGQTLSYANLARHIDNERAFRAVARANAANNIAIIIPCHRIINSDGGLGGYAGGIERKKRLLGLEKEAQNNINI
jgi:AraC family transcriptional regulator of adaptative response/methylated-DNA-[protein]-cysteine methyltransferase